MDAATKPEASGLHSALRYKIIALAGNEYARSATPADAIAGVRPKLVVEPRTEGELGDLRIGVTMALPDGTLASSGGKVVKNVAGYDLPKLVTGALGTLGVITRAVFRVHPLPRHVRSFSISAANGVEMQQFVLAV